MAEVTGLRNNALPYPVYGAPFGVVFPILDADGDTVTGATGLDSEVSKNGDTFADCTNEATEIATTSGNYYLLLTATEMTADVVMVQVKTSSSGAKTTLLTLYPRKLVSLRSGTSQGGAAGYITLDASAGSRDDRWNGCLCVATIDTLIEARIINDYTGSNQQAAVTPNWNVMPDSDDTFIIYLPEGMQNPTVNVSHIGETSQTAKDLGAINVTNLNTLSSHDPGATLGTGTSTLTQAQVTGGAYALNNASFAFASALDFTTTQKTSIGTAVAASAVASVTGAVGSVTAPVNLVAAEARSVTSGTATAGAGSTITLQTALGADNMCKGGRIHIYGGTGVGQARRIDSYVNATKVLTVSRAWETNPDNTSQYAITFEDLVKVDSSGKAASTIAAGDIATDAITAAAVKADAVTKIQSGLSTYAGGDTAGTTTLLSRLSATRAGYMDNLTNLDAAISSLNNLSALINIYGSPLLEIPDSSTTAFAFTVVVRDSEGKLVDLDSSPTIAAANAAGTSRSAGLSAVSHPATGRYTFTYTVDSGDAEESLRITVSGAVSAEGRYIEWVGAVVNYDTLTTLLAVKAKTDNLPAVPASQGDVTTVGSAVSAVQSDVTAIKSTTDQFVFTVANQVDANALTGGGGGGGTDWTADEKTALRTILGIPASGTTPDDPSAGILDTIRDAVLVVDGIVDNILLDTAEIGAAGAGLTALATQASVNDLPTNVEAQAMFDALNQSASRRVTIITSQQWEIPESGSNTYRIQARTYDGDGALADADSTPTLTATGGISGSLAANLSSATNTSTGVYDWTYTLASGSTQEQVTLSISPVIGGSTFTDVKFPVIADFVASTWTAADRTKLNGIDTKLGTPASSVSADIAAVKSDTGSTLTIVNSGTYGNSALKTLIDAKSSQTSLDALVTTVGVAGLGLSAIPKTGYKLAADGADLVLIDGVAMPTSLKRMSAILTGTVTGAGSGTEVFTGVGGAVVTVTVDTDGNRSAVVFT